MKRILIFICALGIVAAPATIAYNVGYNNATMDQLDDFITCVSTNNDGWKAMDCLLDKHEARNRR